MYRLVRSGGKSSEHCKKKKTDFGIAQWIKSLHGTQHGSLIFLPSRRSMTISSRAQRAISSSSWTPSCLLVPMYIILSAAKMAPTLACACTFAAANSGSEYGRAANFGSLACHYQVEYKRQIWDESVRTPHYPQYVLHVHVVEQLVIFF